MKIKVLLREEQEALDLPDTGPKPTTVNVPSLAPIKDKWFRIYPEIEMDEIDKNNIMRACLDLNLIDFPFTSSDVENRKRLYNFAYKKVVLESIENYKEAKKIVFEQATTPQSLNAFRKFAYEKKIGLRKVGMIKDYIKPWTKETADDFVNKIP